jgi:hypothetical protein
MQRMYLLLAALSFMGCAGPDLSRDPWQGLSGPEAVAARAGIFNAPPQDVYEAVLAVFDAQGLKASSTSDSLPRGIYVISKLHTGTGGHNATEGVNIMREGKGSKVQWSSHYNFGTPVMDDEVPSHDQDLANEARWLGLIYRQLKGMESNSGGM